MGDKRELSQPDKSQIQFFWKLLNLNEDKLKELEPHRHFESLYAHLNHLNENLRGDNDRRERFVYQMLKSVMSSLCYIAPLPIIIYSSGTELYEFGVIGRSGVPISVVFKFDVEGSKKATLSSIFRINECNEPIDPDIVENVAMRTGFYHADVLNLEIPGVYRKIRVELNDNKIEIRKIGEEG